MKSQLKAGVMLSYAISIVQVIIQLFYTPIILTILGQSEYGLYTLVGSIISYLSLCGLGFSGSYLRFYSKYQVNGDVNEIAKLNGLFLIVYSIIAIVSLLLGNILVINCKEILGNKITIDELQTAKILMVILSINIAITFINTIFDSIIIAHEAYIFQRLVRLLSIIVNPLLTLPMLLLGYHSIALVSVSTFLSLCILFINIYYCFCILHTRFSFRCVHYDQFVEIFGFSFFIFLNMIIDQINWNVDKFFLGRICGTTAVAVYGVAAQINSIDINISTTVSSVFAPKVNRMSASGVSVLEFTDLFIKIGRVQFILMALIDSGIVFFGKQFIYLWVGENYSDTYYVVLCLVLPAFIPCIQNIALEIQRAKNKHQFRSIIYLIIASINILISIPLSKMFGPIGAALGTTISLIIGNCIIMNWFYHTCLGLNIIQFFKNILSMFPSLIVPIILGSFIKLNINILSWGKLIMYIIFYTITYFINIWLFAMDKNEKNKLIGYVKRFYKK